MEQRSQTWPWVAGLAGGLAVVALLVAAYSIGYNRGEDKASDRNAAAGPSKAPAKAPARKPETAAAAGPGKELFTQNCSSCHTLSAANANGTVGPNLDQLKPDAATVQAAIKSGGTGSGAMPPNIVNGQKAKQIADFVAAAAGQ
jgi:mono/diheme cytochrome c family protein